MVKRFAHFLKTAFAAVGLDVRWRRPSALAPDAPVAGPTTPVEARLAGLLQRYGVDLIIDVGANVGQFALEMRRIGYGGPIVSFEPTSAAHLVLQSAAARDPLWTVASRLAIGDRQGSIQVNIAGNSQSSSVLPMRESHSVAAPDSIYIGVEEVTLTTLDDYFKSWKDPFSRAFLKIDVQGAEQLVFRGAHTVLDRVVAIEVEMSFVSLYEGDVLFDRMFDHMKSLGFMLSAVTPVFINPATGELLQVDGFFLRREAVQ